MTVQTLDELPTPALILDRAILRRNLARMSDRLRQAGVMLRPHLKTAKSIQIGRMAVVQRARGQGVGAAIMQALLAMARERGDAEVELSAQTHALGFYAKFGFVAFGEEYLDVGIPHRSMRLRLEKR